MSAAITVTGTACFWTMETLCAEISKSRDEVKRCAVCGAVFTPKSNRAKYCPDCAVRMRRKKEAERQRQKYWQLSGK